MGKKSAFVLLVLVGIGAYGAHENWDKIRDRLGLEDLRPGSIKSLQLAKNARSLDRYNANWIVLRDKEANGQIKVEPNAWRATEVDELRVRVTFVFFEHSERHVHRFLVEHASGTVIYEGLDGVRPAPPDYRRWR